MIQASYDGKSLDFIVIGAAKSATTTLHELLKGHAEITVPAAKEVPFFSDEKVYAKGVQRYLRTWFRKADRATLWGTVTPHYMIGQGQVRPEVIASRIHAELPDCKLIALLRHPVDRAFSQYKMNVQRGAERRPFEQVVSQVLANADELRGAIGPDEDYIFGSEYGRILGYYYDLFPENNILILTTTELRADAVATVRRICKFLGADTSYEPDDVDTIHRQGGSKPRVTALTPGFLYRIPLIERFWKNLVPIFVRKRVEYFMNLWNSKPDSVTLDPSGEAFQRLVDFYRDDVALVESLTGQEMPWPDWHRVTLAEQPQETKKDHVR